MKRTPPKLALPWILEEDWPQWQAVDRDIPSYEKWVELFDKNLKLAEACGWPYERVSVRPDPFNEWCKANQRTVGKFDRNVYALELLRGNRSVTPVETTREDAMKDKPSPGIAVSEVCEPMADVGNSDEDFAKLARPLQDFTLLNVPAP